MTTTTASQRKLRLTPDSSPVKNRKTAALVGATVGILFVVVNLTIRQATGSWGQRFVGGDYRGYMDGARRFLETGTPYTPWSDTDWTQWFIHPPSALPLFIGFSFLPWVLWWAVPLGIIGYCLYRLRPAPWSWPVMALLLAWPRSYTYILAGNTDIWVAAAIAAACVWGWPAVLAGIKPTLFVFALPFARRRSWWVAGAVLGALTLPFLYLWPQWLSTITNSPYGPGYSWASVPFLLIPLVAWLARVRPLEGEHLTLGRVGYRPPPRDEVLC